jgi:hypothetical protein
MAGDGVWRLRQGDVQPEENHQRIVGGGLKEGERAKPRCPNKIRSLLGSSFPLNDS